MNYHGLKLMHRSRGHLRVLGWHVLWGRTAGTAITRRLQRAGTGKPMRPLRWRDGFCVNIGGRYLLVSF